MAKACVPRWIDKRSNWSTPTSRRGRRRGRSAPELPAAVVEAHLHSIDPSGACIGTTTDGAFQVKAFYGLPDERVLLDVWEQRGGFLVGRVTQVLEASPERIIPPCPAFGLCGGCQWQHVSYERQLSFKRETVSAFLAAVGFADTYVRQTLPAPLRYGYRNHARFSVGRRLGEVGYTTAFHHRFIRVDGCLISHPNINAVLAASQRRASGHQLAVRVGINTGDLLVNPPQESLDLPYPSGQTTLEEDVLGRRYRVSSAAFFQVNTLQAEKLIDVVRAALAPRKDDVLLDLYCGVGTFGLALLGDVRRVVGLEESVAALKDAHYNARDDESISFVVGRAEDVLPTLDEQADIVVVDPPRVGCRPEAVQALIRLAPRALAYVSCDASTLARDLRLLVDGGFTLQSVQPVDMFPQTAHVETVSLLTYERQDMVST